MQEFSLGKLALSAFWQEWFLFPELALRKLHFFLTKNVHNRGHHSHLAGFCSFNLSLALMLVLGAVLVTLIGWDSVDK